MMPAIGDIIFFKYLLLNNYSINEHLRTIRNSAQVAEVSIFSQANRDCLKSLFGFLFLRLFARLFQHHQLQYSNQYFWNKFQSPHSTGTINRMRSSWSTIRLIV